MRFNYCGVWGVFYSERSQTRRTPPCHTSATAEESVVSSSHVPRQLCSPVFQSFPGDHTRRRGGERGCTSLEKMGKRGHRTGERVTPRKSLQSSFYLGQPGSRQRRRRVSSGFCVIVSLLIKVKGVSWIFSPLHFLLDICCFQVEEMLKGWSLSRPHTISNRHAAIQQMCPALILAALCKPHHCFLSWHQRDCFHFAVRFKCFCFWMQLGQ